MTLQDVFGPIATRTEVIVDLDAFILSNIPYAEVPPRDVQWYAIEYDGPLAPGAGGRKPLLQWHFGGVPYPVSKAIRVYYSYRRTWDGSDAKVSDSILLGFQQDLAAYATGPGVTSAPPAGSFTFPVLATRAAILGFEAARLVVGRAPAPPGPSGAQPYAPTLDSLIQAELQGDLASAYTGLLGTGLPVDYDGPAQDYDCHNIFAYTFETLVNDLEKYSRVLFWYFGGRPHRVSKALRIPLEASGPSSQGNLADGPALFIGYTGGNPGGG